MRSSSIQLMHKDVLDLETFPDYFADSGRYFENLNCPAYFRENKNWNFHNFFLEVQNNRSIHVSKSESPLAWFD